MTQQVNLYQPILRRERKVFSAATMLRALGAFAMVMLVIFALTRWQLAQLRNEYDQLRAQERELVARVAAVSRDMQSPPESRELRRQVEAAKREQELKQRLVALLRDRPMASAGFAEAFAGLARQRVNGLWLTGVELHHDGSRHQLTLEGMTARAELVPELVQQLGEEPAFQGMHFRHMRVYQPETGPAGTLAFELTTRPDLEEGE